MPQQAAGNKARKTSRRRLARHEIRLILRDRIFNGECRAGTKLIQGKLAKDFGVSVGVVREALLELQAWGLVETQDNRGVTVSRWSVDRLIESYEIREVLEGLAARRCCGRMDDGSYSRLRDLAQQIHDASIGDDWDTSCRLDREFHHCLIQLCGNRTLLRLSDSYRFLGKMMWWSRPYPDSAITLQKHLEILDEIHQNHPDAAERAAREHVAVARRKIQELAAQGKFEPHWLTS
ncbi:GntR family transcriptional regulator [Fontivita pretiosa]|uniref:GntR family transcriptional regulator n=1 Tax=Fontivita pretiosa TaxID=2989684 RepID=UPI003D180C1A